MIFPLAPRPAFLKVIASGTVRHRLDPNPSSCALIDRVKRCAFEVVDVGADPSQFGSEEQLLALSSAEGVRSCSHFLGVALSGVQRVGPSGFLAGAKNVIHAEVHYIVRCTRLWGEFYHAFCRLSLENPRIHHAALPVNLRRHGFG